MNDFPLTENDVRNHPGYCPNTLRNAYANQGKVFPEIRLKSVSVSNDPTQPFSCQPTRVICQNTLSKALPVLISDTEILQPAAFDCGPRVGREQIIRMPDNSVVTVRFWYDSKGNLLWVK